MKECCEKLKTIAPLFLRLGLGVIFIYHGYGKVFGAETSLGSAWNPELPQILQILVSWGELLGGAAILLGFLTELAALGIIVIMVGAIVTVHGKNGFGMMNGGFEYNFALIIYITNYFGFLHRAYTLCCLIKTIRRKYPIHIISYNFFIIRRHFHFSFFHCNRTIRPFSDRCN